MTMALSKAAEDGAQKVVCASTGNTSASAAAYAARAGIRCLVVVPSGKIGARQAGAGAGAGATRGVDRWVVRRRRCGSCASCAERHPITLVNNLNPYRLEGQKTAALEVVDEIGVRRTGWRCPSATAATSRPGGAGSTRPSRRGDATDLPRLLGCQAAGSAAMVQGATSPQPDTIATAIRIGSPVRRTEAARGGRASRGAASWPCRTRRSSTGGSASRSWRASSASRRARPASPGWPAAARPATVEEGARVVCVLTGHGLKDPDTAIARSPGVVRAPATFEALERIALS